MTKFRNRKRAVFALAFVALSSLALAPGFVVRGPSVIAALDHIEPQLQEPATRLAPPHFRMELPEPDYTVSALPERLQSPVIGTVEEPDFDVAPSERTLTGYQPLWIRQLGAAAGNTRGAGGEIGGTGRNPVAAQQSNAAPHDRNPDATPNEPQTETTPPQPTELASNDDLPGQNDLTGKDDVPPADDLHNPINPPATPGGKPDQPAVAVPEPSALALLLVGVVGLVVCRRRAR